MKIFLLVLAVVLACITGFFMGKLWKKECNNKYLILIVVFGFFSMRLAYSFDIKYMIFVGIIVLAMAISDLPREIDKKITFYCCTTIFVAIGLFFFYKGGYEVVSSRTEVVNITPLVEMNGGYVDGEVNNDTIWYKYYLKGENDTLKIGRLSERRCELKLTDGEARLEELVEYKTIKSKYTGLVEETDSSSFILYVPEAGMN